MIKRCLFTPNRMPSADPLTILKFCPAFCVFFCPIQAYCVAKKSPKGTQIDGPFLTALKTFLASVNFSAMNISPGLRLSPLDGVLDICGAIQTHVERGCFRLQKYLRKSWHVHTSRVQSKMTYDAKNGRQNRAIAYAPSPPRSVCLRLIVTPRTN